MNNQVFYLKQFWQWHFFCGVDSRTNKESKMNFGRKISRFDVLSLDIKKIKESLPQQQKQPFENLQEFRVTKDAESQFNFGYKMNKNERKPKANVVK